jgi:hypothetical protein
MEIHAVDLYCTGDQFRLEITSNWGRTGYFLETTHVMADGCQTITADPEEAWRDGFWSSGSIVIPPGDYTVKVLVESGLYRGGTMAVKVRAI